MPAENQHKPGCHGQPWRPTGWRQVPLSAVAEVRFSSVDKLTEGGERPVRLCNYTDVYDNEYITADMEFMQATATPPEIDRFGLKVGDVIITKDSETPNDIGVSTVVDSTAADLVCGYHLALIRPQHDQLDSAFLAKQLRHHRVARYFGQQANGSTRYGLSSAAIAGAPIRLPRIDDQQKASAVLRLVDTKIAISQVTSAKLRSVRTGLLHDLLTLGIGDDGRIRSPAAAPHRFVGSALGRIPKTWTASTLEECTEWSSGGTPDRSQKAWWAGDVPFLTPKDMKRLDLFDTIEHVTATAAASGSRVMPADTIFIVVRGMILAHTFPVCLSARPFAFNQDIKAIRAHKCLSPRFLAHWFAAHSDLFLRKATEATHGTKKFDMKDLRRMQIAIPSIGEQQEIVNRINALDRKIAFEDASYNALLGVKAGLSNDLLTSQVHVPTLGQREG